jgi:hypothetical protein
LIAPSAPAASGAGRTSLLGSGAKNVQKKELTARSAAAPAATLRVDRTQAQLTISAWDKNEIAVEATVEVGNADP